jgi:hypothetical protein
MCEETDRLCDPEGKGNARGYDARYGFSVMAHMRHDSYEIQTKGMKFLSL